MKWKQAASCLSHYL